MEQADRKYTGDLANIYNEPRYMPLKPINWAKLIQVEQ